MCALACCLLQITLNANNMWGIIYMIVELFMKHEDGKYVLMKASAVE